MLGLLPGGGDLAGGLFSAIIILQAGRAGAPTAVLGRMFWNVLVDTVVGAIPLLGDVFDVAWRSNSKNVRLLESWQERPGTTARASALTVAGILVVLLVIVALGVWGSFMLFGALFDLMRGT